MSFAYALPPDGGFGVLPWTREVCSLLAGHVGNMDGSMGSGDSLKYSCFNASSAVVRRSGLYVRNLKQPFKHVNISVRVRPGHRGRPKKIMLRGYSVL